MAEAHTLTRALLAARRPGIPCAVVEGLALGIPKQRPRGYLFASAGGPAIVAPSPSPQGPGVAVLQVRGVITQREEFSVCGEMANYEEICARWCAAHADPGVAAIVVDGDGLGGDTAGLEEARDTMLEAKRESGKPVIGYAPGIFTSAYVWLFCALTDAMYLHPSARMGSVGTVLGFESDARRAAEEGLDRAIIRDPPGKAVPHGDEPLDELGRGRLESLVQETTARFVADVAAARRLDPAVIRGWNGSIFTGQAAVDAKLADGLGSLKSSIALAASLAGLQEAA